MVSVNESRLIKAKRWNHELFQLPLPIGVTKGWTKGDYKIVHRPKRKARPYLLVTEQGKHVGDYETLELAKRGGDVRMAKETPKTAEQTFTQTFIFTGCKDFTVENDLTLSFTDQHGDRVMVTSEGAHIGKLLVESASRSTVKRGKGGSRATH
jgi:hypothetical protein